MWQFLGWVTGLNPAKIVGDVTGYFGEKVKASASVDIAKVKSGEAIELKKEDTEQYMTWLKQALQLGDQQWPVTRWIRPVYAYTFAFHLIVVVACWTVGIDVQPLPHPVDYIEGVVVGFYFLARPYEKASRK